MEHLVASGSGEWLDGGRTRCTIFYKSPAQWAAAVHAWFLGAGMAGSIFTVGEMYGPDRDQLLAPEFDQLDAPTLVKALEVLEAQGLAELHRDGTVDGMGVKFKERSA